MMLSIFYKNLKSRMETIENPRPFICDGNPLECRVFIVGFNAATEMQTSFEDFWSNLTGFNKSAWLKCYIAERQAKPLAPGKTRRSKVSATRQRIEWLTEHLYPLSCLETNLFAKATVDAKSLDKSDQTTEVFDFLVDTIKPNLIITHGIDAKKYFENRYRQAVPENEIVQLSDTVTLISVSHLSRGWSRDKTQSLATKIKMHFN